MAEHDRTFSDLNKFRGIGEDPIFQPPTFTDRPRLWALDNWKIAPRTRGFSEFESIHWKGLRLLKDPETQATYQNLLWELRPRTIIELGVNSGASLLWFRDMSRAFGFDCHVIGIDIDTDNVRIPETEMENITIREGDCREPEVLQEFTDSLHPILFVDDAHCDTFNIMKWCINNLLHSGDYLVVEDMLPVWYRYSPRQLEENLSAFRKVLALDLVYSNACPQLQSGVFRCLSSVEK